MSTRRRRMDRLEQHHAAASLERMTIEELIDELVQFELAREEPFLTLLLPVAGVPDGMTGQEQRAELDRAFRECDATKLQEVVGNAVRFGAWGAVCSAIEIAMRMEKVT